MLLEGVYNNIPGLSLPDLGRGGQLRSSLQLLFRALCERDVGQLVEERHDALLFAGRQLSPADMGRQSIHGRVDVFADDGAGFSLRHPRLDHGLEQLLLFGGADAGRLLFQGLDLLLKAGLVLLQGVVGAQNPVGRLDELGRGLGLDAELVEPALEQLKRVIDKVLNLRLQLFLPLHQVMVSLTLPSVKNKQ